MKYCEIFDQKIQKIYMGSQSICLAKHADDVSPTLLWYFGKLAVSKKKSVFNALEAVSD